MIISEQWLRELINTDLNAQEIADALTLAGLEVDAVEAMGASLDGVVVGEVLSKEKHPDADRLNLTEVAIGGSENLAIVCGASNVRVGMKVPVATVGSKLPNGLKIKKSKIRGQASFGMLCSGAELGMAEASDGLLELAEDAPIGQPIQSYLSLDDTLIDIDLTPNRGDCLSVTGVARELHVLVGAEYSPIKIQDQKVTSDEKVVINVAEEVACPSYIARVITGVNAAAKTPLWMQERLRRCGLSSISAIVDITNYVMMELGQPMHAFDKEKVGEEINIRFASPKEKITLLNDSEVELNVDTLVIADKQNPIAIAGVMGGSESAIDDETTDIIFEAAHFTKRAVAGTARAYGLHTDSSHRFERGVDPLLPKMAMQRATELCIEICGGNAGEIIVNQQLFSIKEAVELRFDRVRRLLGMPLEKDEVEAMLSRISASVTCTEGGWSVTPPSYRFDIERECDLVEEVARVKGYDNLDDRLPKLVPSGRIPAENQVDKRKLMNTFVALGYQESISYSFIDKEVRADFTHSDEVAIALANPLAENLAVMRGSLWPGLVSACQFNLNRQQERVRIFEVGAVFHQKGQIEETERVAGLVCGDLFAEQTHIKQAKSVDFYDVRADLEAIFSLTGNALDFIVEKREHLALHPGQSAVVIKGGKEIGFIGRIHPNLAKKYDLPQQTYLFELDLEEVCSGFVPEYKTVSKFPSVSRDVALLTPATVATDEILRFIRSIECKDLQHVHLFDVYSGAGIDDNKKSVAVKLTFQRLDRTLTDDEIESFTNLILSKLADEYSIELR